MQYFIDLSGQQYKDIHAHLLPIGETRESAAFIFADFHEADRVLTLSAKDYLLIGQEGFTVQKNDYIELSDESSIAIMKNAHQTNTALIELHSHPFESRWSAAFSLADMAGFEETVPHMWWRLPGRPYAAIVVSPSGFDSLVWSEDPCLPQNLTALRVDGEILKPTGMTLGEKHVCRK